MAQVIYAEGALGDLRRIESALSADDPTLATNSLRMIRSSLADLALTPRGGRPAEGGLQERTISRGRTGYAALYRFLELDDTVLVLAIRHRSEAGYSRTD
jgi:plasmid stabilization system protein ParE